MGEDVTVQKKPDAQVAANTPVAPAADTVKDSLADPLAAPQAKQDSAPPQQARGQDGTAQGRAEYQRLLGESLGDKLYSAIAPHVTFEALSGTATKGLDATLVALAGQLGSLKGDVNQGAIRAFAEQLGKNYGPLAAEWMKTDFGKKLGTGMADWVDANPEWIVGIALLGVAGAIVADMKIPELKQKLNLGGGFDAEIATKLGSLRNICVEELKATVRFQADAIRASLTVRNDQKGVSVDASAKVGGEEQWVETTATMTDKGLEVAGLKGLQRTAAGDVTGGIEKKAADKDPVIHAGLSRQEGDTKVSDTVKYDANSGVVSLGKELAYDKGGNKAKASHTVGSDGSQSTGIDVGANLGKGLSGTVGASQTVDAAGKESSAVKGGLAYDGGKVKANVNAEASMGETTAYKVGGAVTYEDHLNKAKLGYQYDSGKQQHDVMAMGQVGVTDKTAVRGTVEHTANAKGNETKIGAHAAHLTTKDLALFGGGTYEVNSQGKSTFVPEVGAQIKGVPVKVGFDPSDKSWRVGVTIPF